MMVLFLILIDIIAIIISAVLTIFLRDNLTIATDRIYDALPYMAFSTLSAFSIVPLSGISRGFWRYITFSDFVRIAFTAAAVVSIAAGLTFAYNRLDGVARAVPLLHVALIVILLCALRAMTRFRHSLKRPPNSPDMSHP